MVKLDGATGAELWRQAISHGSYQPEAANAVAVDGAGNVAAAGAISHRDDDTDFLVAKFAEAEGAELWQGVLSGSGYPVSFDWGNAVVTDGLGDVIAAGVLMNYRRNPDGTVESISDFTVIKFDGASGGELWRQVIASDSGTSGQARAVKADSAGDVIAAGTVSNLAAVVKFRGTDGGDFAPPDTEPPTVTMTAPANATPLANIAVASGTITVSADASDNVGVTGVQFQLDGAPLGTENATAPYAVSWDTTTTKNGSHTLTAVARDAAGNSSTSVPVRVIVVNLPPWSHRSYR